MRVGLVCPYSFDVHGGVQNHVRHLAAALHGLGHHVEVLAPGERDASAPAYVTTTGRAVPVPYNGSVARVAFGPLVAARVRRWLEAGRFDVLHLHEPATPSLSILALWAARSPVVGTFHTAQERPRALETSAATFLRPALEKVSGHIAVSAEAAGTLARYQDVEPVLIPNGVEVAAFAAFAGSPGSAERAGGPVVVFVGRTDEPRKGLPVLLGAWPRILARHPDARLRVVGGGAGRSLLRGLDRGAARRVELLGAVSDEEKARVLAGADLLVAPNTGGESFGIVLVEAMAAGLPVVASDLPAFRQVLRGLGPEVLFPVGDGEALAAAVHRVLASPALRTRLARTGADSAASYDWRVVAPQVVQVYESVLPRPMTAAG